MTYPDPSVPYTPMFCPVADTNGALAMMSSLYARADAKQFLLEEGVVLASEHSSRFRVRHAKRDREVRRFVPQPIWYDGCRT